MSLKILCVSPLGEYLGPPKTIFVSFFGTRNLFSAVGNCKLVTVTVVFLLSPLLWSRVTPGDRLGQPLSPLNITFPFSSLLFFSSFSEFLLGSSSNTSSSSSESSLYWNLWYRSLRLPIRILDISQHPHEPHFSTYCHSDLQLKLSINMCGWVRMRRYALLVQNGRDGKRVLDQAYQPPANASRFPALLIMCHKSANPSWNRPPCMRCRQAWFHKRVTIYDRGINVWNTVISNLQSTLGTNQPMKVLQDVRYRSIRPFH